MTSDQPTAIKDINQLRILNALREQPGISRSAIARQTGLGKATISTIVADFIERGLVYETGPVMDHAPFGRRPIKLDLNGAAHSAIGVELTGNECIATLTDLRGRAMRILRDPMPVTSVDYSVEIAARAIAELMRDSDHTKLLGVGVGVPGTVDATLRSVLLAENLGWVNVPFGVLLAERVGQSVSLLNRTNAGALGEFWHGHGHGIDNLVYISISVGVGAGIIIDGALYEGSNGSAGEIGHITIDPQGPECRCGNRGCLETLVSTHAIARRAARKIMGGEPSVLARWTDNNLELITCKMIVDAATSGDSVAIAVVQECGTYLGIAIANVINLFNPALVVVDGDLLDLNDLFLEPIRQTVNQRAFSVPLAVVRIVPSGLRHMAAAMGAASVVVDRFFAAVHRNLA